MKTYYSYELAGKNGLILDSNCNIVTINDELIENKQYSSNTNYLVCGGFQDIFVWNLRNKTRLETSMRHPDSRYYVTRLSVSFHLKYISAGYSNGSIILWSCSNFESLVMLEGHHSPITYLCTEDKKDTNISHIMVSGAQDNNIVVWDLINQSGICKLKGHTCPITCIKILKKGLKNIIISSSKDKLIKLWDLELQYCFYTIIGNEKEVWGFSIFPNLNDSNSYFLTSVSSTNKINSYKLSFKCESNVKMTKRTTESVQIEPVSVEPSGSVSFPSKKRSLQIEYYPDASLLLHLVSNNTLYIYKINSEPRKPKSSKKINESLLTENPSIQLPDFLNMIHSTVSKSKIKSFFIKKCQATKKILIIFNHADNKIEINELIMSPNDINLKSMGYITIGSHRNIIKKVLLDNYNNSYLTVSDETVLLWDYHQNVFLRTLYQVEPNESLITDAIFPPGNRYVVITRQDGSIQMLHMLENSIHFSCSLTRNQNVKSSFGLYLTPDKNNIISFNKLDDSCNRELRFWNFVKNESLVTLENKRNLQLEDAVTDIKVSSNMIYLLVALLDSTVKIFYFDTLKFYLSLYGHKLPVMTCDVSSDNTLIITGSLDKNIKIWGMDFGDCHRSLFAHDDHVTLVKFVNKTHYFFSVSKDGSLRYWDGDTCELLLKLEEHVGAINSLDVSNDGTKVITAGKDRTICVWEQTDSQFVVDDEKEKQVERQLEDIYLDEEKKKSLQELGQIEKTSIKTIETLKTAEELIQSIEDNLKEDEFIKPKKPIEVLLTSTSNQNEEALMLLPQKMVISFIGYLMKCIDENTLYIELSSRCIMYLIKIHYCFLKTNLPLEKIKEKLQEKLNTLRMQVGINMAALKCISYQDETIHRLIQKQDDNKQKIKTKKIFRLGHS